MRRQSPHTTGQAALSRRKGVALLITLWLTVILTILVLSFSFMVKTEARSMASYKTGAENKFLAEAGIQRAIMEISYRSLYRNQNIHMEGYEAFRTDGTSYIGRLGDGFYKIRISDESGKLDINAMTDASGILLNNLLVRLGASRETADMIVDSILDWRDQDEFRRLHGAESNYYLSLPVPYKAKNAKFDTLEELLNVKGMSSEILYGKGSRKGLVHFLTVHSGKNAVNINVASREILSAFDGMTDDMADSVIRDRQSGATEEIRAAHALLVKNHPLVAQYVSVGESNTYTIDALGYTDNEKSRFAIRATVVVVDHLNYRYVYYRSPARIAP